MTRFQTLESLLINLVPTLDRGGQLADRSADVVETLISFRCLGP